MDNTVVVCFKRLSLSLSFLLIGTDDASFLFRIHATVVLGLDDLTVDAVKMSSEPE